MAALIASIISIILILLFMARIVKLVTMILKKYKALVCLSGFICLLGYAFYRMPGADILKIIFQPIFTVVAAFVLLSIATLFYVFIQRGKDNNIILVILFFYALAMHMSIGTYFNAFYFTSTFFILIILLWKGCLKWLITRKIGHVRSLDEACGGFNISLLFSFGVAFLIDRNIPNRFYDGLYLYEMYLVFLYSLGIIFSLGFINTLRAQFKIYKLIKKDILKNGYYISSPDKDKILLKGTVLENDTIFIPEILSKMEADKFVSVVIGKQTAYVLVDVYNKIKNLLSEGKLIEDVKTAINSEYKYDFPEIVINYIITEGKINWDVKYDSLTAGFILMKYSLDKNILCEESQKNKILYLKLLNYMLSGLKNEYPELLNFINRYKIAFKIPSVDINILDENEAKSLFGTIEKNIFWHKGIHFGWRNYKYLLVVEATYLTDLLTGKVNHDYTKKYCELLNIKSEEISIINHYLDMFFKSEKDFESIYYNCTNKYLLNSIKEFQYSVLANHIYVALPRYNVAVCATMSSGKSTFINALLGKDYIPSRNEACTAKITSISDNDYLKGIMGCKVENNGRQIFNNEVNRSTLEDWNNDNNVQRIFLEGDLEDVQSNQGVLVINDTPGTNYSQDERHSDSTLNFLNTERIDMIIYLINVEHVSTTDNTILLKQIKEYVLDKYQAKILFLVNKIDSFDVEKSDNIEISLENIKKDLINLGYKDPIIMPVVANAARLFKMVLKGQSLSRKETADFEDLFALFMEDGLDVTKYFTLGNNIGEKGLKNTLVGEVSIGPKKYSKNDILEALRRTGIPEVAFLLDQQINIREGLK